MIKLISNFAGLPKETEYEINGMKYIVSSRFVDANICHMENTINDKFKNYVGSDFADLNDFENDANINNEYVITTAGKED